MNANPTITQLKTIKSLFDKSEKMLLIDSEKKTVERRYKNGEVLYYKYSYQGGSDELSNWQQYSIKREELIQATCNRMIHVWKYAIDETNKFQTNLICTKDAGLDLTDWANIKPVRGSYTLKGAYENQALGGILQETSQFVYLLYYGLCALREIHNEKWIHLDIKMDNICIPVIDDIQDTNQVMKLDFSRLSLIDFDMYLSESIPLQHAIDIGVNDETNLYRVPRLKRALKAKKEEQNKLDYGVDLYAFGYTLQTILNYFDGQLIPSGAIRSDKQSNENVVKQVIDFINDIKQAGEQELNFKQVQTLYHKLFPKIEDFMVKSRLAEKVGDNISIMNKFSFKINGNQVYNWNKRANHAKNSPINASIDPINQSIESGNNSHNSSNPPIEKPIENNHTYYEDPFAGLMDDEDNTYNNSKYINKETPDIASNQPINEKTDDVNIDDKTNDLNIKVVLGVFAIVAIISLVIIFLIKLIHPPTEEVTTNPQINKPAPQIQRDAQPAEDSDKITKIPKQDSPIANQSTTTPNSKTDTNTQQTNIPTRLNIKNDATILAQYEDYWKFSQGLAAVKKDNKWGFINKKGEFVISNQFDKAWPFREDLAAVRLNNKSGFINKQGAVVISLDYDNVWWFEDGKAKVQDNSEIFYINKKGEKITSLQNKPVKKDLFNADPKDISYEDILNSNIKQAEVQDSK